MSKQDLDDLIELAAETYPLVKKIKIKMDFGTIIEIINLSKN